MVKKKARTRNTGYTYAHPHETKFLLNELGDENSSEPGS